MLRNIRLTLEYDGTDFNGWQVQPGHRTVQGELEARIERLFGMPARATAAGRTDAGVHALGQVANFRVATTFDVGRVQRALNGMLPPDIAVLEAEEVPLTFHARFDAGRRKYLYRIANRRRAVGRRYSWWVRVPLDLEAMQSASAMLLGHHDFASFCVAASERTNWECHLTMCNWKQRDGELHFRIEANRFLRSMVRSIVGTLVDIGRGARPIDDMAEILQARDRRRAGPSAPPHGLFLKRVTYDAPSGG